MVEEGRWRGGGGLEENTSVGSGAGGEPYERFLDTGCEVLLFVTVIQRNFL